MPKPVCVLKSKSRDFGKRRQTLNFRVSELLLNFKKLNPNSFSIKYDFVKIDASF